MKTKLVYVLTCAPEDTYIEQALMAVWSARYHNSDTHIVLIVDDKTDALLDGTRAEILNYISEKIVVPFEADKNMHYRSRWLKTSVRKLIKGDYLFIDCDTITVCDLSHIERIEAEIAMCRDENVDLPNEIGSAARPIIEFGKRVGIDLTKEQYYFNSGVMYVRDTERTHQLYDRWHTYWLENEKKGIGIDQPAFAKANIGMGHPVVLLEDRWNCIVQTQIKEIYSAYILHFWHSVSFLYSKRMLSYMRQNGLTDFVKYYILHPTDTFLPPDNRVCHYKAKDFIIFKKRLKQVLRDYADNIDPLCADFRLDMRSMSVISWLLRNKWYGLASWLIVLSKFYRVRISQKFMYYDNYYARHI